MHRVQPTVCHVLLTLTTGGAEMVAARLSRSLRDEYRFLFVCLDRIGELGEQLRREGFAVHVIDRRPGVDWRSTLRLGRFLRRERVDVIHAHQYGPFFYSVSARLFHRRASLLFTEHGRFHPDCRSLKRVAYNRLFLERRDKIIGVGESVRQSLINVEGMPAGRVGVIYNGINLDEFAPVAGRNDVRQSLGISDDEFVIIQVARLDPIKDHATALSALDRLRIRHPRVRLLLVGDGPQESEIRKIIDQRQLQNHVIQLGLRSDVANLLNAADAGLLTSHSEGIPLSLIEAMAVGMPIVATAVGGVPEIVESDVTGFLTQTGDSQAIAGALSRLCEDPLLCKRMSVLGRRRAESVFSQTRMDEEYRAAYAELLSNAGRRIQQPLAQAG